MKRNWILVIVLVLALVVSACGDNGGNGDDAAVAPVGDTPAESAATAGDVAGSTEDTAAATATAATAQLEAAATATPLADVAVDDAAAAAAAPGAAEPVVAEQQLMGVVRASELMDYDVENAADEDLGSVEDIVVTLPDGCINYMVLSFGGILGLGDSQYMIPWRAVSFDRDNERLLLNVDQTALESAPTIDLENLPDFNDPAWDAGLLAYWDTVGLTTPSDMSSATDAGEAVATPTAEMSSTEEVTGTGDMTDTTGADTTGTTEMTGTVEMTDTAGTGTTEEVTGTTGDGATGATEEVTGTTGTAADTDAAGATGEITGTTGMTATTGAGATGATEEVTGTTGMTDDMSATADDTGAGDMTDTAGAAGAAAENPCLMPIGAAAGAIEETVEAGGEEGQVAVQLPAAVRLSELLEFSVSSPQGEDLGGLEDIMVDWHQDRLAYAILSVGGFFGLGDKWFVVPLNALTLDPIEQRFIFDATAEQLEQAPGFDPNALPDTADPDWDQEIRNFWQNVPGVDVDVEGEGG